ncbi:hypothetical protein HKCCE3408_00540 [Rhodobacterales bacterium HKCCE3408]|nr:hypothetical protein [Rhodobacterales bacterium HKCCE3408]
MTLSFQIALMLTVALLPPGLFAIFETLRIIEDARAAHNDNLAAQTVRAASPESDAIINALGIAYGLAEAVPAVADAPELCTATMERLVADHPIVTVAAFIDTTRTSSCNSTGGPLDLTGDRDVVRAFSEPGPAVIFSPANDESGTTVNVMEPVRAADGATMGFVSLSFAPTPVEEVRAFAGVDDAVTLITFNAHGEILTADMPRNEARALLPAGIPLSQLATSTVRQFTARDNEGRERDFTLVPIVADNAYALGSWETFRPLRSGEWPALGALIFPGVMWIASLLVAMIALRQLVVHPVHMLGTRMRNFAANRSIPGPGPTEIASREIVEIVETFDMVATEVIESEAKLEDQLRERDVLLRELHHRVKNNLQLMSSIINMQMRQRPGDRAMEELRRVQMRLATLARFYTDFLSSSSMSRLRADHLMEEIARHVLTMSAQPETPVDLDLDLDPVDLVPEQASPLAMLATEAMTNAVSYADAPPGERVAVGMTLRSETGPDGETVVLTIENTVHGEPPTTAEVGLGQRLIAAFAAQLSAEMSSHLDKDRYVVDIRFARMTEVATEGGT